MMSEAAKAYWAPIGLEIDGRLTSDLPSDLSVLISLRAACRQSGANEKARYLDHIIAHGTLGIAGQEPVDAADAASRAFTLGELVRCGLVPNASVTSMLSAALSNDAKRFELGGVRFQQKYKSDSDVDKIVPFLSLNRDGLRADPFDLLMSTVSTEHVPAQAASELDIEIIVNRLVVRPARVLLMSLSKLVALARSLDRQIDQHHTQGRMDEAYDVLLQSNLVALAIGSWDVRTGHEAVERIEYLGCYPKVFEAEDNFRLMLRAVVAKDALDWGITISRV